MSRRAGKIMFAFLRVRYYNKKEGGAGSASLGRRIFMKLPSDGAMLLSFLGEVEEKLRALGYEYDPSRNAFR